MQQRVRRFVVRDPLRFGIPLETRLSLHGDIAQEREDRRLVPFFHFAVRRVPRFDAIQEIPHMINREIMPSALGRHGQRLHSRFVVLELAAALWNHFITAVGRVYRQRISTRYGLWTDDHDPEHRTRGLQSVDRMGE